jgi:hypothetical protein
VTAQHIGGHRPDKVEIVIRWPPDPVGNPQRTHDSFLPGRLLRGGSIPYPPGHRDRRRQPLAPSRLRGSGQDQRRIVPPGEADQARRPLQGTDDNPLKLRHRVGGRPAPSHPEIRSGRPHHHAAGDLKRRQSLIHDIPCHDQTERGRPNSRQNPLLSSVVFVRHGSPFGPSFAPVSFRSDPGGRRRMYQRVIILNLCAVVTLRMHPPGIARKVQDGGIRLRRGLIRPVRH